ncbi:hypothetical protein [Cupriavidus campinensis]|uniref:Uncharacterized protein n=1 Tax=Cupriavidus campinensis TaxID=151783 RepID=A0ABY3ET22_9BURK|nr:hypothetical protein [Cupriavidus campinensis]TSP13931.1 hypothetical protein FGG12_05495 [Cupriavidus campinensis]
MKNTLAAVAAILTLCAPLAHADGSTGTTTFGRSDCGQWIASPTETKKAWLLGYLSGTNMWNDMQIQYRSGGKDMGPDILGRVQSADQIYVWMDNYCRANPLRDVTDGAFILWTELTFPNAKK